MTKDKGSRRSQKRAKQALRGQEMARKREAAEAAREKAANADFSATSRGYGRRAVPSGRLTNT
jgi:hypothetical protein